ncbi:MAG: DUF2569 family protein, partial [Marinoscillum sp.]
CLVAVLFFQRRTSIVKVITIFYIINVALPLLDIFFTNLVMGDLVFDNSEITLQYSAVSRNFVAALVWIPYFNIAERVKSTFCKTL